MFLSVSINTSNSFSFRFILIFSLKYLDLKKKSHKKYTAAFQLITDEIRISTLGFLKKHFITINKVYFYRLNMAESITISPTVLLWDLGL